MIQTYSYFEFLENNGKFFCSWIIYFILFYFIFIPPVWLRCSTHLDNNNRTTFVFKIKIINNIILLHVDNSSFLSWTKSFLICSFKIRWISCLFNCLLIYFRTVVDRYIQKYRECRCYQRLVDWWLRLGKTYWRGLFWTTQG